MSLGRVYRLPPVTTNILCFHRNGLVKRWEISQQRLRYRKKIFMIHTRGCKIIEDVTNRENDEGQGSPEPKPYRRSPS
jgi:hypothetical protein